MRVAFYVTAGANAGEIDVVTSYDADAVIPDDILADLPAGYSWKEIPATEAGSLITEDSHYVLGGNFVLRPVLYADPVVLLDADGGATAGGKLQFAMPAGTVVISHYDGSEQTSAAEDFIFQSLRAGEWTFDFTPPFPHRPATIEVNVHAV